MANKTYSVLKVILAVICLLLALIIVLSTISVVIITDPFSTSASLWESTGYLLGLAVFFGMGLFFGWAGYRLIKSAQLLPAASANKRMSREWRIILAVGCFLIAAVLLVMDIRSISRYREILPDANAPAVYNQSTVFGFWGMAVLMLVAVFFLIRTGYRLLQPTKEKIELLGETF